MALYSGVTGKISVKKGSGTAVETAHMSTFSVELTKEIGERASFGNDYKEKIPGIKDWTASADGAADFATASGQEDLITAFEDGSKVEATFYLDTGVYFKGDAYVESLSISNAADGHAEISISLSGTNGVTLTPGT